MSMRVLVGTKVYTSETGEIPQPAQQATEGQHIQGLFHRLASAGKALVLGGPVEAGAEFPAGHPNGDREFLEKVDHELLWFDEGPVKGAWSEGILHRFRSRRRETAMEFIARTSIGVAEAKAMTKAEISRRVRLAEERARDEFQPGVTSVFEEQPQQGPRFVVTD